MMMMNYDILWWTNHLRWWWKMMIDDVWHICNPDLWHILKRFFNVAVTIHQNPFRQFQSARPGHCSSWLHPTPCLLLVMPIPGWWNLHIHEAWKSPLSLAFHWTTPNSTGQGAWCWALRGGPRGVALPGGKVQEMDTLKPGPWTHQKRVPGRRFFARTTGEWTMNRWVFGCPRAGPYSVHRDGVVPSLVHQHWRWPHETPK